MIRLNQGRFHTFLIMNTWRLLCFFLTLTLVSFPVFAGESESLFDGQSLEGWEGSPDWWRVENGRITGGSLQKKVPHNTFLATKESFQNFELTLQIRLRGSDGFINSGIQVRSARVPNSSEMEGYQVDVGDGYWGKLYDEKRRGWLVKKPNNRDELLKSVNSTGWNTYRIRCNGPTISAWINGTKAFEYTESDGEVPLNGKIGFQVHGGGKALVEVKNIRIKPLPTTEDAPAWPEKRLGVQLGEPVPNGDTKERNGKQGADSSETGTTEQVGLSKEQMNAAVPAGIQTSIKQGPQTPEEQKEEFILPDGFDIELVAAETEKVGKFVDVSWDTACRMWSMTALEYPVSTGRSDPPERVYKLFERGGKDRVIVYPDPYGSGPHNYRTFVDGLVQPLGILPYGGGVYVQHGQEIRYYRDRNEDGQADQYKTVLTGFGIQDSHLMPHRFRLGPGGRIYTSQGPFNSGTIHRSGKKPFRDGRRTIEYNGNKIVRFTPDGSVFEQVGWGFHNIWGNATGRQGQMFVQDSNDMGLPAAPFHPGVNYHSNQNVRSKPYAPRMPELLGERFGGTGLSGLALANDENGWPGPWGRSTRNQKRFLVANPLRNRIQRLKVVRDGEEYTGTKQPPLLLSKDPWFRPVALHFGPDGALYVVDWYNPIISHNEFNLDHPMRDRRRGRIWRIFHESQSRKAPPNLRELAKGELLDYLGHGNVRLSNLTWREIRRRDATSLVPELKTIIRNEDEEPDRRIAALWALEGLKNPSGELLTYLLHAENGNLRREAVRIIDVRRLLTDSLRSELRKRVDDPDHRVRGALGNLLRRRTDEMTPALIRMALRLGGSGTTSGNEWERYYGNVERYLARWALEGNHSDIKQLISGTERSMSVSPSARAFAGMLLDSGEGAKLIARASSDLDRSLTDEEFSLLAEHFQQPAVRESALSLLQNDAQRDRVLDMLTDINPKNLTKQLRTSVEEEIQQIFANDPDADDWNRVTKLAGTFRLTDLAPKINKRLHSETLDVKSKIAGIKTLKQIAPDDIDVFVELSDSNHAPVRREALLALTTSDAPEAFNRVLEQIRDESLSLRTLVLNRLASSKSHAPKLVRAALNNRISGIDGDLLKRLESVLGKDHDGLARLRKQIKQRTSAVLTVGKKGEGYAKADITLDGAFTVEAWVKLIPPITNRHHLVGATDGASDFNFHRSKFRVYNGEKDVVIAESKIEPRTWTHVAVTRDDSGQFTIYINGERDAEGSGQADRVFKHLQVGTGRVDGAEAFYTEFRVWSEERTGKQIRKHLLNTFRDKSSRPSTLTHYFYGDHWPPLKGNAEFVRVRDVPGLNVQKKNSEQFQKYLSLAEKSGNADNGKQIFENRCSTCHTTGGEDKKVGPSLKGVAHSGTTAVLNSVLYPDASIQAGYRQFRIKTTDGNLVAGIKTGESEEALTVQLISGNTKRVPRDQIQSARYINSSLMPKGLLSGLSDKQVRDLFSYLETLK